MNRFFDSYKVEWEDSEYIRQSYFEWLCHRVNVDINLYGIAMRILFDTEYFAKIPLDENRIADAYILRAAFCYESNFIEDILNEYPINVLEVLVELAVRCDEDIMYDPDIGDRAYKWFWIMIENMGLDIMNGELFNKNYTNFIEKVNKFLNRTYRFNGEGGPFPLHNPVKNQQKTEIWYQMNAYLLENYGL